MLREKVTTEILSKEQPKKMPNKKVAMRGWRERIMLANRNKRNWAGVLLQKKTIYRIKPRSNSKKADNK